MGMIVGALVALAVVVGGAVWVTNNVLGGATLEAPAENGGMQSVTASELRAEQRLSNGLFEFHPGGMLRQAPVSETSSYPAGERLDLKIGLKNLHEQLSLRAAFLEFEVVAFDSRGREIWATVYAPEWGLRREGVIPPGELRTATILIIHDPEHHMEEFAVYVHYREPGRTEQTAMAVWPVRR